MNLFETSIRHLGGLLSAYACSDSFMEHLSSNLRLSGRPVLLEKAEDLGHRLRGPEILRNSIKFC